MSMFATRTAAAHLQCAGLQHYNKAGRDNLTLYEAGESAVP